MLSDTISSLQHLEPRYLSGRVNLVWSQDNIPPEQCRHCRCPLHVSCSKKTGRCRIRRLRRSRWSVRHHYAPLSRYVEPFYALGTSHVAQDCENVTSGMEIYARSQRRCLFLRTYELSGYGPCCSAKHALPPVYWCGGKAGFLNE